MQIVLDDQIRILPKSLKLGIESFDIVSSIQVQIT